MIDNIIDTFLRNVVPVFYRAQADTICWQEKAMPVTELTLKSAMDWIWKLDRMAENSRTACVDGVLKAMEDETVNY